MQDAWNLGMVVAVAPVQREVTTSAQADRGTDGWGQWEKHPYLTESLLLILSDAIRAFFHCISTVYFCIFPLYILYTKYTKYKFCVFCIFPLYILEMPRENSP